MRTCARAVFGLLLGSTIQLAAFAAHAANYPERAIQLIVPFAPGGTTDIAGRLVAKALGERLEQTIVVDNKPGAAGAVGVAQLARSKPDGYTMALSGVGPSVVHELLGRQLNYDPQKDLNPVAYLGSSGMVIVTRKDSPLKSLGDMLELARSKPGAISFGSAGNGSPGHLAAEYLSSMAGVQMTHIPYSGDSALMPDLIAGRIDIASIGIGSVFSQLEAGTVSALAITSAQRLPSLPDLPTVAESGVPGYEAEIWNLLVLPKNTPSDIDAKLNAAINDIMADATFQEQMLRLGTSARQMSAGDVGAFIGQEREKWAKVIKDADIKVD